MTLIDTSVWIDHFRRGDRRLAELLEEGDVVMHDFVLGELACGNFKRRTDLLENLRALPFVDRLDEAEVHAFVSQRRLHGHGIGWVDAHLLAAAVVADCDLWTRDQRLRAAADRIGLAPR